MKHVVRLKSFPHSLHWEGFPQNGFSGTEYSVLCRWGLAVFWAFGFPSHVWIMWYWVTEELLLLNAFPHFCNHKKFSGTNCLHLNRSILWSGLLLLHPRTLVSVNYLCFKRKHCSGWWLFNIHWTQLLSSTSSLVCKSLRPSPCCHISSTLEFLPELTEHPISELLFL